MGESGLVGRPFVIWTRLVWEAYRRVRAKAHQARLWRNRCRFSLAAVGEIGGALLLWQGVREYHILPWIRHGDFFCDAVGGIVRRSAIAKEFSTLGLL